MKQTKGKANVRILAVIMSLVFVVTFAAVLFNVTDDTDTAYAAGTRALDTITIADMYANKDTGKYGNFSWDTSKLKEITSTSFTIKASVAVGYQPFYICWTKPSGMASPTKLRYGYTPGSDVTGQSASKGLANTLPTDNRASGGNYAVEEITLYGNNDTMYFYISSGYMYEDIVVTSITFQPKVNTVKVTATAGTGVQSVYLSKNQNATSGSNSGTNFDKGDTVYAFAKLAEGYKRPNNNWTLVSGTADTAGAIYRVSSSTMGTSDYSFGTINATGKTKWLSRNTNGAGSLSGITLIYGQTANLTIPSRDGYNFIGWNTKSDGTGTTYGDGSNAELTATQVNEIIANDSISAVYAMWKIDKSTVISLIDAIPDPVVYTQDCKNAIDTAREGYDSLSAEEKPQVTNYDILTAAESTYGDMQADKEALDLYKNTQKGEADDLAREGDSADCEDLIANAKNDIDSVVYDCTKTLEQNKAVVDAILSALENNLNDQRAADSVDALIAAIPTPVTLESKGAIDTARAAYAALTDAQKALVDSLEALEDAETDYEDVLVNCEATIDGVYYWTIADAFAAAEKGATIKINKDYSIVGRGYPYITVNKDVTVDLDGHTLTIGNAVIWVTEGAVLSVVNSKPATGGIKGVCGADSASGSYVLLYDCRLALNASIIKQNAIINHIADGYFVEDLNGGATDENGFCSIVRPITVADVIAYINAIDDPVVYTADCKAKIDEARALYDGLKEDKDDVTNYETLTNAESIYGGMQDDKEALDLYKDAQKGEADDLALEGDSAACEALIADAKDAIDAVSYDCTLTIDENKAAVDKIIDDLAAALALQRDKEAFEAYKVPSKQAADALALESDSAVCEDMIANAKNDIDALVYDEDKTLAENKAIIDGMVDDLAAALALQRDKEAFEAYKEPSKQDADDLAQENDSATCEDMIANAKNDIDALVYDEDKTLAENKAIIDGMVDALADALALQRDIEAFDAYKVPSKQDADDLAEEEDSADCENLIANAKNDIDSVVYDCTKTLEQNKAVVDAILSALENNLNDQRAADSVDALIAAIPTPVTLESKGAIDTARAAYAALTDTQKALVDSLEALEDAEADYEDVLVNCEATIDGVYYWTIADAFTAAEKGATIKINKDYSIVGRGYPYITVNKDVTIDLSGRTLTIGQSAIAVMEGAVLTIENTVPATGGIIGGCGVDSASGSYVLLYDCRLVLNAAIIKQYAIINHIADGYFVEDLNGGDADENGFCSIVRPITVADVIAYINAIDDPVVYTADCKAKIDEARALYDGLKEDKDDVTNYETLTNAESIYGGMQDDKEALDLYKDAQKGEADDLALEGDSAACEALIADAKDAIDAVSYDCTLTIDENKAAVDKIIDDLAAALALQRDKEAFEAYKVPSKQAADDLAAENDSAACEDMIANAKNNIDALVYDEEKTLTENKAIINGMVDDLADALQLQRDKEAFEAYKVPSKQAADELALESDSAACETLIANAKDAIDALNYDEEKTLTENKAIIDGMVDDLADALQLQRDKEAFEAYKVPSKQAADDLAQENDSVACKTLIANAKDAIDALNYDEDKTLDENKAIIDDMVDVLADALALQRDKEAFEAYKVPSKQAADDLAQENDSAACKTLIANAKDAIDALNYDEDKTLAENKAIIDDMVDALADALQLQRDKEAFEAYKVPAKQDADDLAAENDSAACEDMIANAKNDIDALVYDEDKTLAENKAIIDGMVDALADALALQRDKEAYDAYKVPSKQDADDLALEGDSAACKDLIADAKADIDTLVYDEDKTLAENKAIIDGMVDDLADALDTQRDNEAAADVDALIDAIPDPVTYPDSKDAIDAARNAYNALTDDQKALVKDPDDLTAAEADYKALEDAAKANAVKELINSIGDVEYTEDCKDKIDAAKDAYDALSPDQKALIEQDVPTMTTADDTYRLLRANSIAAAEVIALIEAIGEVEYTEESKAKIEAAMEAFNELTDDQKALVENHTEIPAAETTYTDLENQHKAYEVKTLIAAIGKVSYPDSKESIEVARVAYDKLSVPQKALVDNYDVLTAAEEKYAKLESGKVFVPWIIILSILLVIGLLVLALLVWRIMSDKKGNTTKVASVALFPLLLCASYTGALATVWILAVLTVLVFAADVFLAVKYPQAIKSLLGFSKKDKVEPKDDTAMQEVSAGEDNPVIEDEIAATEEDVLDPIFPSEEELEAEEIANDEETKEDEEEVIVVSENDETFEIRFAKSFTAKLIQTSDETKAYYQALKNEMLSYEGISNRTSWHYDSFNFGRKQVIKMSMRGKTLCLYFPLDVKDFENTKYKVELCESAKYAAVPCMYRIINDRRADYAKDLIAMTAKKFGLEKGAEKNEEYSFPYEERDALVAKGLIREVKIKM